MSVRFSNEELIRQFSKLSDELLDLMREPGELLLVPGDETIAGRTQWTVTKDGHPILALGYTRREAMRALVAMTNVLSLVE